MKAEATIIQSLHLSEPLKSIPMLLKNRDHSNRIVQGVSAFSTMLIFKETEWLGGWAWALEAVDKLS